MKMNNTKSKSETNMTATTATQEPIFSGFGDDDEENESIPGTIEEIPTGEETVSNKDD